MSEIRVFSKSPQSYPALLSKLSAKGLTIKDVDQATHQLRNIGYYRLMGYGLPYEVYENSKRIGRYKENIQFNDLVNAYLIDGKIRTLLLSAIERIEVTVRNIINHELACKYESAHWFIDQALFKSSDSFTHSEFLRQVKNHTQKNAPSGSEKEGKREVFIHHYYSQYDSPDYPPCWMIAETLPLGSWSKVYEHLNISKDRKIISRQLDLAPATMQSWLHSITYLRNMCAHHSRLFGRKFVIRPTTDKKTPYINDNRLFNYVCVLYRLLKTIEPDTQWLNEFYDITEKLNEYQLAAYGFKKDWLDNKFWLD